MKNKGLIYWLVTMMLSLSFFSTNAQADMVSTQELHNQHTLAALKSFDRQSLIDQLQSKDIQQQLISLGISSDIAEERISSLTDAELAQYGEQLQNGAAASGAGEIVLGLFLLFVITDMLCATDIFNFVNCINK
jgi:hypothetical protein